MKACRILTGVAVALAMLVSTAASAAGSFISFRQGDLLLADGGGVGVYVDPGDMKGVGRAAASLCEDFMRVTGARGNIVDDAGKARIVVGTIGSSAAIDKFVRKGVVDGNELKGKREKYIITVAEGRLVIAGSDRRGTIYGVYELSRQMGVSPWYWWADAPVERHERVYALKGVYTDGEPMVRYRGIFLNDEAPCLTSWVKNRFGTDYGGHEFYGRVYELLLRLKGNFLWPAMWCWAFYADDAENSRLADEMGIVVSTSHHEPMARNHQEWSRRRKEYGAWNYATNKKMLDSFFREGIERMKGTEDVVTIGMRGDGDAPMTKDGTDTKLLEKVIKNQRKIIKEVTGRKAEETPQVWALYKEVQDYYDAGMEVPDDVTLLIADDNWGDVRRVPLTEKERKRKGGFGLYYHVDYVGTPRNSKWLNVTPTQNMWEQLALASQYGIDRLWVLNVGDLKPMEYQIDFFLDMAWNGWKCSLSGNSKSGTSLAGSERWSPEYILDHTLRFCRQQFGESQAEEAARILNLSAKLAGRCTGEMLDAKTYNIKTGEWERAVADYDRLEADALRQFVSLKADYRDCYEQLVLFPIQAMANLYRMYHAHAKNMDLAERNDPEANYWAGQVRHYFRQDSLLMLHYNKDIANGKWDGMMTQKHIGYTTWNDDFPCDRMPEVKTIHNSQSTIHNSGGLTRGFVFSPKDGYLAIEAEHVYELADAKKARWTLIPHMGRTKSGLSLQPYTESVDGASLTYKFVLPETMADVSTQAMAGKKEFVIHVISKCTLDFLNQGGLHYTVAIDGQEVKTVNFNERLNTKKENVYSIFYPTVARRIAEAKIKVDAGMLKGNGALKGGEHTLTIIPRDPGIVFEKVVVDFGGYQNEYLFGVESPYRR